ncbi:MAG: hypothetical protein NC406_05910 [Bacteroides sp.]|nr:hypothetical protein [Bacteroides sp.]MCM1095398.1 hypothetical protein [Terasakiella sp.]
MRKYTAILFFMVALAAAAASVEIPVCPFVNAMRRYTIPDSLYCKYFEKEYFNPKPTRVLPNGVKVLLNVDAIGHTSMQGQVDESERPHYVVLETPDGRRYIGTADIYDDKFYPAEGYLDGDYGLYRWTRDFKEYPAPKKIESRWMIDSEFFTGKSYVVWNMFNSPELYSFVDLRPGQVRNEVEMISNELLPQLPYSSQYFKKGRSTREVRTTTGGYNLNTRGSIYGPLSYTYDPKTGRLSLSATRKVSSSKYKLGWWTDAKLAGKESPEWAAYCQNDLSVNPTALQRREFCKAFAGDDSSMVFFGKHDVEVVCIAADDKSWMVVRRVIPPGRKHYRRDYSMWLANPGVFHVDYVMHNAIAEGINNWLFDFWLSFDRKVVEARQREWVLDGREQELYNYWYVAAGAVVGARKAPDAILGTYALSNAMAEEAYRMGAPEPIEIDHVFGPIDDETLRRMSACPLIDSEILSLDPETLTVDVNLTLSRGGKTWVEPRRFTMIDRTQGQGIDVRIPTDLFINLPDEPGEHAIVVSDVVAGLKTSAERFKQSLKAVKPSPSLSSAMKDYLKTASSQKFNGRNLSDVQAWADALTSLEYSADTYAGLCSELTEGNARIAELTKKLPAVARVWTAYFKTSGLKPLTVEDAGSLVAENTRLSAIKAEQQALIRYIGSVQESGDPSELKDFTEEQMLEKIRPRARERGEDARVAAS